jgi:hypothetical protein
MRGARPFSDRYWRGRRLASLVAVPVYILLARKFDTRRLMMFGLASFGLRDVDLQLHYPRVGVADARNSSSRPKLITGLPVASGARNASL